MYDNRNDLPFDGESGLTLKIIEGFFTENRELFHSTVEPLRDLAEYDTLIQEAFVGSLKGLQTWSNRRKMNLHTYALVCANAQLLSYLKSAV